MKVQFSPQCIKYLDLINDVFNNHPRGNELLDYWGKSFLCAPCCPTNHKDEPFYHVYRREGENNFIRHIMNSLNDYDLFKQQERQS